MCFFLTLSTSLSFIVCSYKIFPILQNNRFTLKPVLEEVSIKKSKLFFSLSSSPCFKVICLLLKTKLKIKTYFSGPRSALLPIKINLVSGLHSFLHCLVHSSIELKELISSIA